jgi:hypothetical protein
MRGLQFAGSPFDPIRSCRVVLMRNIMKNEGLKTRRAWFRAGVFKIKEYFAVRSPSLVIVIGVLTVILVGLIDLVTGTEISLSIFYLVPIAFTTQRGPARDFRPDGLSTLLHPQAYW